MVQVDVFFSYGIGANLAVASSHQPVRAPRARNLATELIALPGVAGAQNRLPKTTLVRSAKRATSDSSSGGSDDSSWKK